MARTREEERLHKQRQRQRRREEQAAAMAADAGVTQLHAVPAPPVPPPVYEAEIPAAGEFERKVEKELAALGEVASERMPGMAGNAIAMARILDNPAAIMQHAGAAGQLRAALLALHEAAKSGARTTGKVRMLRSRHVG